MSGFRGLAGTLLALVVFVLASCGGAAAPAPSASTARPAATSVLAAPPVASTAAPVAAPVPPRADCPAPAAATASATATRATITLDRGAIVILLRADKAPLTVANFVAKARACFYDGLTFHRVEPNFVIQGGDPKGNGTGGNSTLPTEPNDLPFVLGALGIARGGDPKISNDAQFFICTGECRFLDKNYTNFGLVSAGQEIANTVKVGDRIKTIRVE